MIRLLFRKIYLYIVGSVFLAMVLTVIAMNLFFRQDESRMQRVFLEDQVSFIQFVLKQSADSDPALIKKQIGEIGQYLRWRIAYWQNGKLLVSTGSDLPTPSAEELKQLAGSKGSLILESQKPTRVLAYLDPSQPAKGYVLYLPGFLEKPMPQPPRFELPGMQKGPPHPPRGAMMPPHRMEPQQNRPRPPSRFFPIAISAGLILLFLGLLLIPFVLYILKPFKELSASIEQVTKGDFSRLINIGKQKEFELIANAFNQMMKQIQAMLQEKQRLIADVSHELRSPLARMRVSLELLAKEGKGKPKYIERSIHELEELDRLINDLLDISALELNAENYPLERLELGHLLRESLESHQYILAEQNLQIETRFPSEGVFIKGRRDLLHRALNNLFSNIIKYAPESTQVDIEVFSNQKRAGIRLRDRGPGLPTTELNEVLKPFYRPDSSRTRKTGGNGLGLAIVDKIMRLHNGRIYFSEPSDQAGGLVATLEWPVMRNPKTAVLEAQEPI
jgi:signal transduction histidine kinase